MSRWTTEFDSYVSWVRAQQADDVPVNCPVEDAAHVAIVTLHDGSFVPQRILDAPRLGGVVENGELERAVFPECAFSISVTSAMKRKPRLRMVFMTSCAAPLSPTACRAALMRLLSVASDTMRPFQTDAIRSSLETTCARFSIRKARMLNTWGSTGTKSSPCRNSKPDVSSA